MINDANGSQPDFPLPLQYVRSTARLSQTGSATAMVERPHAAMCGNDFWQLNRVYGQGRRERLALETVLHPEYVSSQNFAGLWDSLLETEAVFSTWGMDEDFAQALCGLPKLRAFFYAAGSIRAFAKPLLEKNILVVSGWAANAIPVAQFTVSQIILALKGYFRNVREAKREVNRGRMLNVDAPGVAGAIVALLGCGSVARAVTEGLRPLGLDVAVYDPFLSESAAADLCLRKVGLDEAFAFSQVVSNHMPDLPETKNLLGKELFSRMLPGATFINTGRGATVRENELAEVLSARPDLTALLDVTYPEPPATDSPFYGLDNAVLSTHIAGSQGNEVLRLADYCLEEFRAWREGRPLQYRITAEMLARMA